MGLPDQTLALVKVAQFLFPKRLQITLMASSSH